MVAKKFWNWLRNESTGERILRLDGIISDGCWLGDNITPQRFREELNSGEGNVIVYLNSEGGDVFAAVQIYNMLKEYTGGSVTIKIEAMAASAASVIAMAGEPVEISPLGMIMIHNPWTIVEGDSEEMQSAAKMLDEIKETLITAYADKTHLLREEISRMMSDETWLHAERAVELGFADKILSKQEEYSAGSAAASISSRRRIMNFTRQAIRAKLAAEKKSRPKKRETIAQLRRRLRKAKEEKNNGIARAV